PIGALEWELSVRGLLKGEIGGDWNVQGPAWQAHGRTVRLADGRLRVSGMRMQLPAMLLQPVLDIPALAFLGTVDVELDDLLMRGLVIDEARGRARWSEAGAGGARGRAGRRRAPRARGGPRRGAPGGGGAGRGAGGGRPAGARLPPARRPLPAPRSARRSRATASRSKVPSPRGFEAWA